MNPLFIVLTEQDLYRDAPEKKVTVNASLIGKMEVINLSVDKLGTLVSIAGLESISVSESEDDIKLLIRGQQPILL